MLGAGQIPLEQKLANYSLWGKSNQLPAFVNKVLLEHSHMPSLCLVWGCFVLQWQS